MTGAASKTTRSRLLAVIAVCGAIAGAARAQPSPLAPLEFLAGHCWEGEFAEGGSWDRHCYEWAYEGRFLRDRHVVTGKRGPYGGETLYRFDGNDQQIVYHYFDSTGGYSTGRVEPAEGELRFPEERYQEGDRERVLRTVWRRDGDVRLISVTEERKGDQWVEAWRVTYVRG